ncbi:hypothetical protein HRE53_01065 [Acaryochloris sp. 'Moss Beach']|uniref:hypothetical protein n=1 Tax=Acaryochloris sp. 'Moss Beach' TaxID=2740837 RepID=UPI001F2F104D|nr:hypothetical protein [Acaryochloris sp. 'Moss Beach']UJB72211.1 hypothetical protein HRE53_01065 [Acaryochloris sp. 'Moss Beach']
MIYPIIYWISSRKGASFVLGLMTFFSFSYLAMDLWLNFSVSFSYKGSGGSLFIPYLFTWGVGIFLAELEAGRTSLDCRTWLPSASISNIQYWIYLTFISCLVVLSAGTKATILFKLFVVSVFCGTVVYLSTTPRGGAFWSKSWGKIFSWIGLFSYSLYVTHRPFLLLMKSIVDPFNMRSESLVLTLLATLLCIFSGFAFFWLFERWTLKSTAPLKLLD